MPYSDIGNNMNKARVAEAVRGSPPFKVSITVENWEFRFQL